MKTIAIVAGGTLTEVLLPQIRAQEIIIGVDRGAWWLLTNAIIPDIAIGDFDSVSPEELQIIKETSPNVAQYKVEKDETDLELAIQLASSFHPKTVKVFGSIGTRMDHTLAGIFLLENYEMDITVVDESNELSVIRREKKLRRKKEFPYCSFLPLTQTAEITLEGFKYPLKRGLLHQNKTLGVSNEIKHSIAKVTVHSGVVLCIQSRG